MGDDAHHGKKSLPGLLARLRAPAAAEDERAGAGSAEEEGPRSRKLPMTWLWPGAASYALTTLFLALFAWAGTIARNVPATYGIGALLVCAGFYAAFATGWNRRFRDSGMVLAQSLLAFALQLVVVTMAPQVAFPFLANLFTVFAFAMTWLRPFDAVLVCLVGVAGTGLVFYGVGARLGVPTATPFEIALTWLYFLLTLGRCVVISRHAASMRRRLFESRKSLRASIEEVERLARYDELTRLLNRRSLLEQLHHETSRAERSGVGFSIALFDIDHFKRVNDTRGHAIGDEVLMRFAERVRAVMRDSDVFGRYGGEEFMLIMSATLIPPAHQGAERLRLAIAAADWDAVSPGLTLTVSAGVASWRKGEPAEQLIGRADAALYEAKGAGRNQVRSG